MNKNKLSWWELVAKAYLTVCAILGAVALWWLIIGYTNSSLSLEQRVERLEERVGDLEENQLYECVEGAYIQYYCQLFHWGTTTINNKEIKLK